MTASTQGQKKFRHSQYGRARPLNSEEKIGQPMVATTKRRKIQSENYLSEGIKKKNDEIISSPAKFKICCEKPFRVI